MSRTRSTCLLYSVCGRPGKLLHYHITRLAMRQMPHQKPFQDSYFEEYPLIRFTTPSDGLNSIFSCARPIPQAVSGALSNP